MTFVHRCELSPRYISWILNKSSLWNFTGDNMCELIIPPANEVAGVYSDPYDRPFVRSFVRPSLPISNPLLLWNRWTDITTYGGGDPSLIRYSSKTAEQNFMKLSGIVYYMMPYCTSYFKFLFEWFWGFPEQNKDFAIQNIGERGVSFCEHCSQYF